MGPISVVVADDHASVRLAVRAALEVDGFAVVADVDSGPAAVRAVLEHRPAVCVLDVHMPGGGGIEAAEELSRLAPETAVVMLTASADDDDLFAALAAGAKGYLLKDVDPDRLGAALRGVLAGEAALPRALAARVMASFAEAPQRAPRRTALPGLTARESEVLDLMVAGLSTEQIAARLYVGQVTVRTHVSNVLKKLKVSDREAAVRLARDVDRPA